MFVDNFYCLFTSVKHSKNWVSVQNAQLCLHTITDFVLISGTSLERTIVSLAVSMVRYIACFDATPANIKCCFHSLRSVLTMTSVVPLERLCTALDDHTCSCCRMAHSQDYYVARSVPLVPPLPLVKRYLQTGRWTSQRSSISKQCNVNHDDRQEMLC